MISKETDELHALLEWVLSGDRTARCPLCAKTGIARILTENLHGRFHLVREEIIRFAEMAEAPGGCYDPDDASVPWTVESDSQATLDDVAKGGIPLEKLLDLMPGDPVNHPSHYTCYKGFEVVDIAEQLNFNRGNVVKYILRAGVKEPGRAKEVEDLRKAAWYCTREVERLEKL